VKYSLIELLQLAKYSEADNKKFFARLKKNVPKDLDIVVANIHDEVFQTINCLDCANCCKSISPIMTNKDIERIAKFLKLRPSVFTEKYLHVDEDGDYVFNLTPCPFLDNENYCKVYDVRPKACSEYPHTNRRHFVQIINLTLKNTFICPAAYEVVERLKENYR
jgi:Fe-S-cluster containining protein